MTFVTKLYSKNSAWDKLEKCCLGMIKVEPTEKIFHQKLHDAYVRQEKIIEAEKIIRE